MYRLQNVLKFMKSCIYRKQDFNSIFLDFYIFFCNSDGSFDFYKTCGFFFYNLPLFYIKPASERQWIYSICLCKCCYCLTPIFKHCNKICFSSVVYCFRIFHLAGIVMHRDFFCYEGRIDGYFFSKKGTDLIFES